MALAHTSPKQAKRSSDPDGGIPFPLIHPRLIESQETLSGSDRSQTDRQVQARIDSET